MGSIDPTGIEAAMREAQVLAQPFAAARGVTLRGAFTTDDAAIDTDGDGSFEAFNPDTGAGTEPGHNFIHCIGADGDRVHWTVTEADVLNAGMTGPGQKLHEVLELLLDILPGRAKP